MKKQKRKANDKKRWCKYKKTIFIHPRKYQKNIVLILLFELDTEGGYT